MLERLKYKERKGVINNVLDAEASVRESMALLYVAIADYNKSIFEFRLAQGNLMELYQSLITAGKNSKKHGKIKNKFFIKKGEDL